MKVRCNKIVNSMTGEEVESAPDIRVGATCLVLGVHAASRGSRTMLRITDCTGPPHLRDAGMFAPVDDTVPAGWAVAIAGNGSVDVAPRPFLAPGSGRPTSTTIRAGSRRTRSTCARRATAHHQTGPATSAAFGIVDADRVWTVRLVIDDLQIYPTNV